MKKIPQSLLILFALSQALQGQVNEGDASLSTGNTVDLEVRLFNSDEPLSIDLAFDISRFKRVRSKDEYLDAVLKYYPGNSDTIVKNIKLKARGNFRHSFCDFPPLLLNFKLKNPDNTEFSGVDKIKLVPPCKRNYQEYVLREYLVYRLFNVLTDNSLRVRLLRINYINTGKGDKIQSSYGFVIEPIKVFEKRTGTLRLENTKLTQRSLPPSEIDRVAVFNFMIGNTDWGVPDQHNLFLLIRTDQPDQFPDMVVPYDFDYSGFVNADYAVPLSELGIKNFRERIYQGMCRNEETYLPVLSEFIERKNDFYDIINDFPYLKDYSKRDLVKFLEQFFKRFDKRNSIVSDLQKTCKNIQ